MYKTIIAGVGEVGAALYDVLAEYDPISVDPKLNTWTSTASYGSPYKETILHICFPFSPDFIKEVKRYQKEYNPVYTVIHSTVPLGTSRRCTAIHSPIRGLHPHLAEGIRTFVKFIGGKDASRVADYFRRAGLTVALFDEPETTEAMKLFDTEYYRACIEFAHRVKEYCTTHRLSFHEVYGLANQTYNEAYEKLGHPEYRRPVLQPIMTPIGGHCVLPNKELIKKSEHGRRMEKGS